MKYANAETLLPQDLLEEVRRHFPEGLLYINRREEARRAWGDKSGARAALARRNEAIRRDFRGGRLIDALADQYSLSVETIKKIVYSR